MTIIIISLVLLASLLPHLTFTAHVDVGIVHGYVAKPHSRPYMVSLQRTGNHICGGFLISDQFVLTAANCWNKREILMVVVGAHDLRDSKSSDQIRVRSYIPHPNYTYIPSEFANDIMLLKLVNKVELNKKVEVIPLPMQGEVVKTHTACSVAGWGNVKTNGPPMANRLREANVTTINKKECEKSWGKSYSASKMICVYGPGGSCKGDSGGPLVCGKTAVGVTSVVDPDRCNSHQRPNVYTKISKYIQWIQEVVGNV